MKFINSAIAVLVPACMTLSVSGMSGTVFNDLNHNGQHDVGEPGLPGIRVSDGLRIVQTGTHGHFKLEKRPGATLVFASRPIGFRSTTPFYHPIGNASIDFGFSRVKKRPLVFFQVTDTEARGPEAWLDEVSTLGRRFGGNFLIHTGDIIGLAGHAKAISRSGMENYFCPGNHDLKAKDKHSRTEYEKYLGPIYYSFDAGEFRFFALVYEKNLANPDEQFEWLKQELKLLEPNRKFVVFRHEPVQYDDRITRYLLSHESKRLAGWISGHTHSHLCRKLSNGSNCWECAPAPAGGLDHSPRAFRIFRSVNGILKSETVYPAPLKPFGTGPHPDPEAAPVMTGTPWPMTGRNPERNAVADVALTPPFRLCWTADAGGPILHSSPVIYGNLLYVATCDDDLATRAAISAFDIRTGKLVWKYLVGTSVKGGIAADEKYIYASDANGKVVALNRENGSVVWEHRLPQFASLNGSYGALTVRNGILYLFGNAPVLLNTSDGTIRYEGKSPRQMGGVWAAGVTIAGNTAVSGVNWRQGLNGFDAVSGIPRWNLHRGRDFTYLDAAPVYADGRLFFKARKHFFVIDPDSGKITMETSKDVPMETSSIPVVSNGRIVYGSRDGIHALDVATLDRVWHFRPGLALIPATPYTRNGCPEVAASPIVAGRTVVCGASDGKLYALAINDGEKLWEADLGAPVLTSIAVSGNLLVAVTLTGKIFAFTADKISQILPAGTNACSGP